MRSFLIGFVCLAALGGGVILGIVCVTYPLQVAQLWSTGNSVYNTAASEAPPDSPHRQNSQGILPEEIPAQPNWTWHTSDGRTYNDVVIKSISPAEVTITHSLGVAHIPLEMLPPDIQKRLHSESNRSGGAPPDNVDAGRGDAKP